MKFTQVLWKFHIGRMIKRHWFAHGKQVLVNSGSEEELVKRGIQVFDSKDLFLKKPHASPKLDVNELFEGKVVPIPREKNEKHPDYNEKPCFRHNNYDLLVQGLDQAQLLTKTLIVSDALPAKIENLIENTTEELDEILIRIVCTSNIFDAYQKKLPIVKDPERPAWVFPRDFGIDDVRKSRNLTSKMIQLCESLSGSKIVQQRQIVNNGLIQLALDYESDLLLFNSTIDMMVMSNSGLKSMDNTIDTSSLKLPDIYPIMPTISLHSDHFYQVNELYPVSSESPWMNMHTLFIYHDVVNVKNFTELPVTESQLLGRILMKSFVAAASYAKQKFGYNVQDLPEPITIQCVQTNSQSFHFSVFQLNTLKVDGSDGKYNLWWSMPKMNLFTTAAYCEGKPTLAEYNPEVFKRILAFYKNI